MCAVRYCDTLMLVFIDESGDPGRSIAQGSSRFFVLAIVMFEDHDEATRCEQAIAALAEQLGRRQQEFRFSKDSHQTRWRFLNAVRPSRFTFHAVVLDKQRSWPRDHEIPASLYEWACGMALRAASDGWSDATVLLDSIGDRRSQRERQRRLRDDVVAVRGPGALKRLTTARSHSQRLLQLADYVAGIVMRQLTGKKWGDDYFADIERRGTVQRWQ